MKYPRSPYEKVGDLVYFGRMVDKIRLHSAGELHPELHANLGKGFDEACCTFLQISYENLCERVNRGGSDQEILAWAKENGRPPAENDIFVWNEFMRKRGWNDDYSEILARRIRESGFEGRTDIHSFFDYLEADEGKR